MTVQTEDVSAVAAITPAALTDGQLEAAPVVARTRTPWIDVLRILAACAVVVLHVSAWVIVHAGIGSADWWAGSLVDASVRWCVPVFVLISGWLLLEPRPESPLAFYRNRAARVLVPLVFWSLAYPCISVLMGDRLAVKDLLLRIVMGEPFAHLWYLYMACGLYLVTPFLRTYIRSSSERERWWLVGIALLIASVSTVATCAGITSGRFVVTRFLPYLGYYLCGSQLQSLQPGRIRPRCLLLAFVGSVAVAALGLYLLTFSFDLNRALVLYDFLSLPVMAMSVAVFLLVRQLGDGWHKASEPQQRAIHYFASTTLGVYVIHPLFLKALEMAVSPTSLPAFIGIPLVSMLVLLLSLVAVSVMFRIPYLRRTVL